MCAGGRRHLAADGPASSCWPTDQCDVLLRLRLRRTRSANGFIGDASQARREHRPSSAAAAARVFSGRASSSTWARGGAGQGACEKLAHARLAFADTTRSFAPPHLEAELQDAAGYAALIQAHHGCRRVLHSKHAESTRGCWRAQALAGAHKAAGYGRRLVMRPSRLVGARAAGFVGLYWHHRWAAAGTVYGPTRSCGGGGEPVQPGEGPGCAWDDRQPAGWGGRFGCFGSRALCAALALPGGVQSNGRRQCAAWGVRTARCTAWGSAVARRRARRRAITVGSYKPV